MEKQYKKVFKVEAAKVFTKHYETASWYKNVLVQAGDYPIKYTDIAGRETSPEQSYYGMIQLPGTVTESCFINRVFTSCSVDLNKHVGETETITLQFYSYNLVEKEGESK